MKIRYKQLLEYLWLGALILTPIILWVMPSTTFDAHSEDAFSICPSKLFFDFECLGCGMTRAVLHFHNFEFSEAVYYNTGVLLVYPSLILVWALFVIRSWKRLNIS